MTEETAVVKAPINIDLTGGIVPKDYNEALQMASLLHASKLVPQSLDSIQKVAVAIFMCIELGRPIMTGIQDISVINGKPGIFGDAALAIVRASGLLEKFKEWEKGTPYTEDWTFYCLMKRRGMPDEREGSWSWQDSIRAGFDKIGPPSPWAKYTRRMMQFKARNFPLRDEFGDVLKGMRLSEDNMDAIEMYPDDTGAYKEEAKTEKVKVEVIDNMEFQAFAKTLDIDSAKVEAFIKATAKGNDLTEEMVMAKALKEEDSFKTALEKWVGAAEKDSEKQDGPDLFDRLKAMRPGTSAQNKALFKQVVLDNLDEIRSWSDKQLADISLKWGQHVPDSSLEEILAETAPDAKEEQSEKSITGNPDERPPNPPMFGDLKDDVDAEELEHTPPWKRRKHFLDAMKDLYDKNREVYFNVLAEHNYEKADDVPAEADKETEILAIMKEEVPGQ